MAHIEIGQLYVRGKTTWRETAQYSYRAGCHVLELFLARPTSFEIEAVGRSEAGFAVFAEKDVIVFLYRFGDSWPWCDAPFSHFLVSPEERTIPPEMPVPIDPRRISAIHLISAEGDLSPDRRLGAADLTAILVDADSGVVRSIRIAPLSAHLTWVLHDAIRRQIDRGWPGDAEYDRQLAEMYARYPTPTDLANAAQARCIVQAK